MRRVAKWNAILWAGLVLALPFTSLPLMANLVNTDTVAPLSGLLAGILLFTWLIPFVVHGGRLPLLAAPLLGFLLAAGLASALAFFINMPPLRERTVLSAELEAGITLAVGMTVYFIGAAYPRKESDFRVLLFWVNWGGACIVVWSLLQAVYVVCCRGAYPLWMERLQDVFSIRRLFYNRVTGFAYEPSWLGHQLNMIYLPLWLAASAGGVSAHRWRAGRLTVENFLLAGGSLVLFLSISRIGWLSFGLVAGWLGWRWLRPRAGRLRRAVLLRLPASARGQGVMRLAVSLGLWILFAGALGLAGLALVQAGSRLDPRLENLGNRIGNAENFYDLANKVAFAERVVFWAAGWRTFDEYPLLGVGLGNAGFFFGEKMPTFGWSLPEINDIYARRSFLPNTKSLWVRLLAETGIAGFACFAVWLYFLWRAARLAEADGNAPPIIRTFAAAGTFALLALLFEGFSVDSFALPYIWLALGWLTAAATAALRGGDDPAG
jgi:O-antigen ligase